MEKEVIAVKQTDQIEVFMNQTGGITIQQTDSVGEESMVVFWAENVDNIIDALKAARAECIDAEKVAED